MTPQLPAWLDPSPWLDGKGGTAADVERALRGDEPGPRELVALLSPAADPFLEAMAQRARDLTQRHFGRTVSLYAPLYLSNHCTNGCAYCGFASDRDQPRRRLERTEVEEELSLLKGMGFEEVLLLSPGSAPPLPTSTTFSNACRWRRNGSTPSGSRPFP
jgi:2-iminoacetate synthase